MPIKQGYILRKKMINSLNNSNNSKLTDSNQQGKSLPTTQLNLQKENYSLIKATEDVLSLSADAMKAYFKSQASFQNTSITTKNALGVSSQLNSNGLNSPLELNGNSNKLIDSASNDLMYLKGSSNQINSSLGNDTYLLVGSKNKIVGNGGSIDTAILGDSNHIGINNASNLSATIKGNTNKVTAGGGSDFILLNGNRNNVSTGAGDDAVIAYGTDTLINVGDGNDVVMAKGQNFNISAGSGNDTISTEGNGKINGEDGDDTIEVKGKLNTVNGGSGNDTITFYDGNNTINGDEGDDTFILKFSEGRTSINGGKGNDTIEFNFKKSDYAIINSSSGVTFYQIANQSKKLEVLYKDTEYFKFSDGEVLSVDQLKNEKGLTYTLQSKDKTAVKSSSAATNVLDLNIPVTNLVKSVSNATGVSITFKNLTGQLQTLKVQNFNYLKVGENQYIDIKTSQNFEYLNLNPAELYVINTEKGSGVFQSKFYDKTTETLLLTKNFTSKSNFLFNSGTFLTGTELLNYNSGKAIDVTIDSISASPGSLATTNTANLKFSTDKIEKIEKTGNDSYILSVRKSDLETTSIALKNFSFINTEEGDKLSLAAIYENLLKIRNNEKSHSVYSQDSRNTEFRRIAYNLTGKTTYLKSLIDGGFENLSAQQKATVESNALKLENSITFTSDYSDKSIDEATKKLYTLRTANLLRNRSDVLESLINTKLNVGFTKNRDYGGNSTGFTTGYASYYTSGGKTKYEANFVLSAFYGGIYNGDDGDSVDIHETLHILDFISANDEGLPTGMQTSNSLAFASERTALFSKYNQTKSDVGVLRKYGFTNTVEFLSVAVENFYERPNDLKLTSANLYDSLSEYFKIT